MGTFISIIGFVLMGISIVLMLFGIGIAIVDTFWGAVSIRCNRWNNIFS